MAPLQTYFHSRDHVDQEEARKEPLERKPFVLVLVEVLVQVLVDTPVYMPADVLVDVRVKMLVDVLGHSCLDILVHGSVDVLVHVPVEVRIDVHLQTSAGADAPLQAAVGVGLHASAAVWVSFLVRANQYQTHNNVVQHQDSGPDLARACTVDSHPVHIADKEMKNRQMSGV